MSPVSDPRRRLRCAIYTRVSTDHGLDQEFNSLDAQREACEAYITSQKHEGWSLMSARYDDGGFSGGSMARPALTRLLADIEAARIDVVVVYKVDRLTRSLADFAKLVELFDARTVSFVSVTQSFNTTSSMGRLTLNVLLSFAQFEREVTGERIRDKIAASKKKGMRVGGPVALGYTVRDKKLVVEPQEAEAVRLIFSRYLEVGCLNRLVDDLRRRKIVTKRSHRRDGSVRGGIAFTKGPLGYLLRNRVYVGEVKHKGRYFPGEHDPIVPIDLFDAVQRDLDGKARNIGSARVNQGSWLSGKIHDDRGNRMTATTARKGGVRYRYYTSTALLRGEKEKAGSVGRVSAPDIEAAVLAAIRANIIPQDGSSATEEPRRETAPDTVDSVIVRQSALLILLAGEDGVSTTNPLIVDWSPGPQSRRRKGFYCDSTHAGRPIRAESRARLVEGIACARNWVEGLVSGKYASTLEIANAEGRSERSVRYLINLAFLSPAIVKAAVDGALTRDVSVTILQRCFHEWRDQELKVCLPDADSLEIESRL